MFVFKQNFMCGLGREQDFVLNNKYDQLFSVLGCNYFLRLNCTLLFKLFT